MRLPTGRVRVRGEAQRWKGVAVTKLAHRRAMEGWGEPMAGRENRVPPPGAGDDTGGAEMALMSSVRVGRLWMDSFGQR